MAITNSIIACYSIQFFTLIISERQLMIKLPKGTASRAVMAKNEITLPFISSIAVTWIMVLHIGIIDLVQTHGKILNQKITWYILEVLI